MERTFLRPRDKGSFSGDGKKMAGITNNQLAISMPMRAVLYADYLVFFSEIVYLFS